MNWKESKKWQKFISYTSLLAGVIVTLLESELLPFLDMCYCNNWIILQGSGGSEELLKWEESKKWQKTVEKMRTKIKERDSEIDKLQKSNKMLKDMVDRYVHTVNYPVPCF